MKARILVPVLAVCVLVVPVLADPPMTPYAGQQTRTIKARSDAEIAALLKGDSMVFAKAAELTASLTRGRSMFWISPNNAS